MRRRRFPLTNIEIPNLAPMVDVVMVILIFFMLGTSLAIPEGVLPTRLPSQIGPGGAANVTIIPSVRIDILEPLEGDGCRILVMDRELPDAAFDVLAAFLAQRLDAGADPNGRVLIAAQPRVQYQYVIAAMDACVQAGFGNIQFSVEGRLRGPSP